MRGEEGGWPDLSEFTVGCRDARMDMHATDFRRLRLARSACTGIAGTGRSWECAVRVKQLMSTLYAGSKASGGDQPCNCRPRP